MRATAERAAFRSRWASRPLATLLALLLTAAVPTARLCAQQPPSAETPGSPAGKQTAPPADDGIHDPELSGTELLQNPAEAFKSLPKATGGNYVNWTEAIETGRIAPRYVQSDPRARPEPFDLTIVRKVRGFTPPAIFPHAPHAEWIDCPVCHPGLFRAAKGANSMTMAEIMLGQKCGVCHGTVAFPAGECRRCHYHPESNRRLRASAQDAR